jgi:hypothetical protein
MNSADAQKRILSACLRSPSLFIPIVHAQLNGGACLDATTRKVLAAIRPDDHDQASFDVSLRLEADPAWPDMVPNWTTPARWLPDLELAGYQENEGTIRSLIDQLKRDHRRTEARARLLRASQQLDEMPDNLRGILGEVETAAHKAIAEDNPGLGERFLAGARTLEQMRANPAPIPESLLGDGLLRPGQLCLIHGADGSRKSWAALHLAVAMATGTDWFGIPSRPGGVRVGLVSLEDDEPVLLSRLNRIVALTGADEILVDTRLVIVTAPHFIDPLNIADPAGEAALASLVEEFRLEVLIIDHLTRLHILPDERDLRPVSEPLVHLARSAGIAIPLLHHDRKAQGGGRPGGADQGAARGDSRLTADARLIVGMKEVGKRIRLAIEKCTTSRKPAPIWLEHDEGGALVLTDAPANAQETAAANRTAMLTMIQDSGSVGARLKDIGEKLGLSTKSVQRYAGKLIKDGEITREGKTDLTRYFSAATKLATHNGLSGTCRELAQDDMF